MGEWRVSHVGESYALVGDSGEPFAAVAGFLGFLRARRCSPNTEAAYAYDLAHFFRFLDVEQITYQEFTPPRALRLLRYLRELPNRGRARRLRLVPVVVPSQGQAAPGLALDRGCRLGGSWIVLRSGHLFVHLTTFGRELVA